MRAFLCVVTALGFLAGGLSEASAGGSLWTPEALAGEGNLTARVKGRAFQVHEIVHVVVLVSAESTTDEEVELEKESTAKLSIDQYIKLVQGDNLLPYLKGRKPEDLGLDLSSGKEFTGEGTAEREDTLRARLAAEIIEIKPNGNLMIEARSRVTKSRETTMITLTGMVSPEDVTPENTVFSYDVANVDIRYESTGPVADANRRGWAQKVLDKLWPF